MNETSDLPAIGDYQRELVLDQCYRYYDAACAANDTLDQKNLGILQASSIVAALVGAGWLASSDGWRAVAVALLSFAVIMILTVASTYPSKWVVPGNTNWPGIYRDILIKSDYDAFTQVLSDILNAIEAQKKLNHIKNRLTLICYAAFGLQILGFLIAVLL